MVLLCKVAPDVVQERDYFLAALENPFVLNGIRAAGALLLILFLVIYRKYRKNQQT